jgi:hypothetical protein
MKTKHNSSETTSEIFKSIRIRTLLRTSNGRGKLEFESNQVFGHINYLRIPYSNYDYEKGDEIDIAILDYCKKYFISAELVINIQKNNLDKFPTIIASSKGTIQHPLVVLFFDKNEIQNYIKIKLLIDLKEFMDPLPNRKLDTLSVECFLIPLDRVFIELLESIKSDEIIPLQSLKTY